MSTDILLFYMTFGWIGEDLDFFAVGLPYTHVQIPPIGLHCSLVFPDVSLVRRDPPAPNHLCCKDPRSVGLVRPKTQAHGDHHKE